MNLGAWARRSAPLVLLLAAPSQAEPPSIPSNTWVRVTPQLVLPNGLTGRYGDRGWSAAAYDSAGGRILTWERYIDNNPNQACPRPTDIFSNSIWGYDAAAGTYSLVNLNHWRRDQTRPAADEYEQCPGEVPPSPVDRHPAFTYISDTNSLFGWAGLNMRRPRHPQETWLLDLATNEWREVTPSGDSPRNIQNSPNMVYDPLAKKVVIVDADDQNRTGRFTWYFDVTTEQYEKVDVDPHPAMRGATGGHQLAYDSQRQRVWLFGAGAGLQSQGGNQLWQLDTGNRTWTCLGPHEDPDPGRSGEPGECIVQNGLSDPIPPKRAFTGFVYIPRHDVLLLYGGDPFRDGKKCSGDPADQAPCLDDTWVYDPNQSTWQQLAAAGVTDPMRFVDMDYDPVNDVVAAKPRTHDSTWWIFRFVPGGGVITPPPPPTGLRAE